MLLITSDDGYVEFVTDLGYDERPWRFRLYGLVAAVLSVAVLAGCVSSAASGSSGGGTSGGSSGGGSGGASGGSINGISEPAVKGGSCAVGPHTIEVSGGLVTGTLNWECQGSVLMQLNVRLIYLGNNADVEHEVDEGQAISVDNITSPNPSRLSAPCTSGLWKMKIVGAVTPAIGPVLTINTSDKTKPPFNDPQWQNPTVIKC